MTDIVIVRDGQRFSLRLDLDATWPNEAIILNFLQAGELYEPDVSHAVLRLLATGDTFLDVGANIGYYTVLAGALVGGTGRVVAFEPDPRNRRRLVTNLSQNARFPVTLVDAAVSDTGGTTRLFMNADNAGGNALWDPGLFPGNSRSQAQPRPVDVPTVTIDDTVRQLGLRTPKLIKIDVEGAEHLVLKGARDLLAARAVPYIIAERHPFGLEQLGSSDAALRAMVESFGYETFVLYTDGRLPRLIPPGTRLHTPMIVNYLFSTRAEIARAWPDVEFDPRERTPPA